MGIKLNLSISDIDRFNIINMYMKKYNFNESYLLEGFFDDLEDDLDTSDVVTLNIGDITEMSILLSINQSLPSKRLYVDKLDLTHKCIYIKIKDATSFFDKEWKSLCIEDLNKFQHMLSVIKQYNIEMIDMSNISLRFLPTGALEYIRDKVKYNIIDLDFYNLIIRPGSLVVFNKIRPKNLCIDSAYKLLLCFINCDLTYANTFDLSELHYVNVSYCLNILDYSFINMDAYNSSILSLDYLTDEHIPIKGPVANIPDNINILNIRFVNAAANPNFKTPISFKNLDVYRYTKLKIYYLLSDIDKISLNGIENCLNNNADNIEVYITVNDNHSGKYIIFGDNYQKVDIYNIENAEIKIPFNTLEMMCKNKNFNITVI